MTDLDKLTDERFYERLGYQHTEKWGIDYFWKPNEHKEMNYISPKGAKLITLDCEIEKVKYAHDELSLVLNTLEEDNGGRKFTEELIRAMLRRHSRHLAELEKMKEEL